MPAISAGENIRQNTRGKRSGVIVAVLWVIATVGLGVPLFSSRGNQILGTLAGIAYIAALIWHLLRGGQPAADLPDPAPIVLPRFGFRGMLWVIILSLGLLFASGIVLRPWTILVVASALIALGIIVVWRRRLSVRMIVLGLIAGLVSGLGTGCMMPGNPFAVLYILVTTTLLFVGGALLLDHTGLARVRLLEGKYASGLGSFLWACVLALPPALLNILGGAQASDTWVDSRWKPLCALTPGIAEETWARLFLTTLCYALLRPTTNDRPQRAVVAAVLVGALTHGLVHLPTAAAILSPAVFGTLLAGLVYGVPMALLFIKRDLECAVGYHFFVDFVRFLAALLWL